MEKTSDQTNGSTYGIGAVARLTGVSVHNLRVWERRHNAVKVIRSDGGRRLYTAEDVNRLTLLKRLVDRGETIGRIAHLTLPQLQARFEDFDSHLRQRLDDQPGLRRVAIFGEFHGMEFDEGLGNAEIVVCDSRLERFRADVRSAKTDTLVIELPIVTPETRRLVSGLRHDSGADQVIVVTGLGRREDVQLLGEENEVVMRAPVSMNEISRAIAMPATPQHKPAAQQKRPAGGAPADPGHHDAPPRRYSRNQLGRLAAVQSSVDCECPHHLVELIDRLSNFEEYSADCENRNSNDAALHAFLHTTTAQARALIEGALERVVEAEGLDPGPR